MLDQPRVLIAEDRPSVLKLVTKVLLKASYDVRTASSGAAALSLIATESFDVVLTDVRMPGASGFDVLRAARDRSPRTRVVLITAYANVPDAVAAMRLGAYDYVAKPLDAGELAIVVARAIAGVRDPSEEDLYSAAAATGGPGAQGDSDETLLGFHRAVEEARRRASRNYLRRLMAVHEGNVTQAAKQAGMTRESLHRVLRQFGIRSEEHRDASGAVAESGRAVS